MPAVVDVGPQSQLCGFCRNPKQFLGVVLSLRRRSVSGIGLELLCSTCDGLHCSVPVCSLVCVSGLRHMAILFSVQSEYTHENTFTNIQNSYRPRERSAFTSSAVYSVKPYPAQTTVCAHISSQGHENLARIKNFIYNASSETRRDCHAFYIALWLYNSLRCLVS